MQSFYGTQMPKVYIVESFTMYFVNFYYLS